MWLGCGDSSMVAPGSGGEIERVFTTAGNQYDDLKKKDHGQDTGKYIEDRNEYQIANL
jgi:hypothetical protein